MLAAFFLALAVPAAVLIAQAYSQLKWQAFRSTQVAAEELAARIDATLRAAIAAEDARSFGDYSFLVVEGDAAANFVQRSPLSAFPVASAVPGVLGYFQVDAAGKLTTPLLPDAGVAAASYGITPAEEAARAERVAELRELLARNQLVRGQRDEARSSRAGARASLESERPRLELDVATAAARRSSAQAGFDRLAGAEAPRSGRAARGAMPRASRPTTRASGAERRPQRDGAGSLPQLLDSARNACAKSGRSASRNRSLPSRPSRDAAAADADADAERPSRGHACARSRARSIRSSSACSTRGISCCSATSGATASATCKARSSIARRSSRPPSRRRTARAASASASRLDVAFQGRIARSARRRRERVSLGGRGSRGNGAAPRAAVAAVRRHRAHVPRRCACRARRAPRCSPGSP